MKEKIRNEIAKKQGVKIRFKYNGARNQNEEFYGYIENVYSNVFTIRVESCNTSIKTFRYGDVLTGTLQLFDKY